MIGCHTFLKSLEKQPAKQSSGNSDNKNCNDEKPKQRKKPESKPNESKIPKSRKSRVLGELRKLRRESQRKTAEKARAEIIQKISDLKPYSKVDGILGTSQQIAQMQKYVQIITSWGQKLKFDAAHFWGSFNKGIITGGHANPNGQLSNILGISINSLAGNIFSIK